ncbi:MAG TPA: DUF2283 domain-containing protein [Candidatus Limnocylindria bacterium]|nr:DUF2283 domain-containing protein [Candidatus Limnocylindria bacterium]
MRLRYQPQENSLRLTLDAEGGGPARRLPLPGLVDVGEGGRLVGVELHPAPGVDLARALARWRGDAVAAEYVSLDGSTAYIELSAPDEASLREQMRAAEATLAAELDASGALVALSIPRHGAGYEISYPSGNQ